MPGTPLWLDVEGRPLSSWLHLPLRARVGVVYCLPIGDEAFPAYRAFRLLADELEDDDVASLRFDYTATGDSAGALADLESCATWVADIGRAATVLRDCGIEEVYVLGMRVGTLLAARASMDHAVDGLVLWDPCETGRRFLREQRLLGATGAVQLAGPPDPDVAEQTRVAGRDGRHDEKRVTAIPGMLLGPGLTSSISSLDLAESIGGRGHEGGEVPRSLVLARPERPLRAPLRAQLVACGASFADALDQEGFFDVDVWHPARAEPAVATIRAWIDRRAPRASARQRPVARPTTGPAARVARDPDVIERPVRIGGAQLFGMVAEPAEPAGGIEGIGGERASVLLLNTGLDRHIGPSRLWVDLARRWAAMGLRVVRLDLPGIGESPPHAGRRPEVAYPADAIDDIVAAASYLSRSDPASVLLIGACSGGYHAAEAAAQIGSRAVWLINPAVPSAAAIRDLNDGDTGVRRESAREVGRVGRRLVSNGLAISLAHRLLPPAGWWLLDKVGAYTFPLRAFRPLIERGTRTYVVCGRVEARRFLDRGTSELRRLERSGRFALTVIDYLDHTLLGAHSRAAIADLLDGFVRDELVPHRHEHLDGPPRSAAAADAP